MHLSQARPFLRKLQLRLEIDGEKVCFPTPPDIQIYLYLYIPVVIDVDMYVGVDLDIDKCVYVEAWENTLFRHQFQAGVGAF